MYRPLSPHILHWAGTAGSNKALYSDDDKAAGLPLWLLTSSERMQSGAQLVNTLQSLASHVALRRFSAEIRSLSDEMIKRAFVSHWATSDIINLLMMSIIPPRTRRRHRKVAATVSRAVHKLYRGAPQIKDCRIATRQFLAWIKGLRTPYCDPQVVEQLASGSTRRVRTANPAGEWRHSRKYLP